MPKRITLSEEDVTLHVHPESNNQIQNDRAAESEKRQINEIQPDAGSSDVEPLTNGCTNAKQIVLNYFAQFVHSVR
jgi:hypothetical protein